MKFPFSFSIKLIFRLVLPGLIFSISIIPAAIWIVNAFGFSLSLEYFLPISTILAGWFINLIDMHIYMLYEGRRYWPSFLWKFMTMLEEKRIQKIEKLYKDSIELYRDPLNHQGEYEAQWPTRLGKFDFCL